MVERVSMRRSEEVRLKLGPDMLVRLNALAEVYGFPVATMSAMAVAEWVVGKETAQQNQRMMLLDISRKMSGDVEKMIDAVSSDPSIMAAVSAMADVTAQKARDQLTLPLEGKGVGGG